MSDKILTVSEITREINQALKNHVLLRNCWVTGEISNYKEHLPSGHWYFTLKDEYTSLKAVMFRTRAASAAFKPQNGMKVIIRGSVKLYEKNGSVQLYAEEIFPSGLGALYIAFEQLKNRLAAEGLFAPEKKKPIPKYPQRIAIITSPTGAAIKDILNIAGRRNPLVKLMVFPSAVQGETASQEIAEAIARANNYQDIDLLIVGRGGGSLEELWAFNTEEVARAIAGSRIPVISAVGHEIDFTIADFVADLRAPTPSAAAEIAVPLLTDMQTAVMSYQEKLNLKMAAIIEHYRSKVRELSSHRGLARQAFKLEQARQEIDILAVRLQDSMTGFLTNKNGILKLLSTKIDMLSPLTTLGRGYVLAYNTEGEIVNTVSRLTAGDKLQLQFKDGRADCEVKRVDKS
ncbi:MAG: exodeoxyribonuclease VII large subunit [Peptococcaceae bacterium]|nr:exodeoxyribonuclease VII large subunit [Peptococcaceae bacterium]